MKTVKKSLVIVMALLMLLCTVPMVGAVDEAEKIFDYEFTNFGVKIYGLLDNTLEEVVVPDTIEGRPVKELSDGAFWKDEFKKIVLPDTLESIGAYAFFQCENLESVHIPDSVLYIKEQAFSECPALKDLTISKNIRYLGKEVFNGCTAPATISFPDDAYSIGDWSLYRFIGLTSVTLPSNLERINAGLFSNCFNLKSIDIPDTVTSIGHAAFDSCTFTSITIPDSVTEMDTMVFGDCASLTDVKLSKSLTEINDYTFIGCTGLTEFVVPDNIKHIGEFAFSDCYNLKSVVFPEGLISIGTEAFRSCFALKSVTIPASVETIGEEALGCSWYEPKKMEDFVIYGYAGTAAEEYANENGFKFIALPVGTEFGGNDKDVGVIAPDGAYNGDVTVEAKEIFEGTNYNYLINSGYKFKLYDITTVVDGSTAQPNGSVWVKAPLPQGFDAENIAVYYIGSNGEKGKMNSFVKDGYIYFEASHFSNYAIVDESPITCSHICHRTGIAKFFYKIALLFWKMFKINKTCTCGVAHY